MIFDPRFSLAPWLAQDMLKGLGRVITPSQPKKNDMKSAVKLIAMVVVVAGAFVANSCCCAGGDAPVESAPAYIAPAK